MREVEDGRNYGLVVGCSQLKKVKLIFDIIVPFTIKFAVKLTVVAEFDAWQV